MSEEILGAFPGWMPTEMGVIRKGYQCKLVFTTDRLIVAKEKRSVLAAEMPYYVFTLASTRDRLKMQEVSAEGILKESPENFEIPYSDITVIELKKEGGGLIKEVIWLHLFMGDLDAAKYKIMINVNYKKYMGVIQDFVRAVLPDKV